MESEMNQDLSWLAFRYVADEMSAEERQAFEQRLVEDQEAREEVARAVELAQAVAFVHADVIPIQTTHHSPLTTHPRRWVRPAWWAAAAAIMLGILIPSSGYLRGKRTSLATVWQSLRDTDETSLGADGDEIVALITDDEADLTVPAWLIEAVSGSLENQRLNGSWEET